MSVDKSSNLDKFVTNENVSTGAGGEKQTPKASGSSSGTGCQSGQSRFMSANVLSDLRFTTGISHYADKISSGVMSRVTAQDFLAITQGVVRSLLDLKTEEGNEFFEQKFVVPEVRLGPPAATAALWSQIVSSKATLAAPMAQIPRNVGGASKKQPKQPRNRPKREESRSDKKRVPKKQTVKPNGPANASNSTRALETEPGGGNATTPSAPASSGDQKLKPAKVINIAVERGRLLSKAIRSAKTEKWKEVLSNLGFTEQTIADHISSMTDDDIKADMLKKDLPPLVRIGLVDRSAIGSWTDKMTVDNLVQIASDINTHKKEGGRPKKELRVISRAPIKLGILPEDVSSSAVLIKLIQGQLYKHLNLSFEANEKIFVKLHRPTSAAPGVIPVELSIRQMFGEELFRNDYTCSLGVSRSNSDPQKREVLALFDRSSDVKPLPIEVVNSTFPLSVKTDGDGGSIQSGARDAPVSAPKPGSASSISPRTSSIKKPVGTSSKKKSLKDK